MRKLIYAINITIDGCCDHTKNVGSDDVLKYHEQLVRDAGVFVYGRKTYQLMVPYWPDMAKDHSGDSTAANDFADAFASTEKIVVFSRTLERAEPGVNTNIVRSDLQGEIQRLKQEPGKYILTGGADIPSQLIALALVDEYIVVIQPLLVGIGRRLLDETDLPERLKLKLVESTMLESGCIALRYVNQ